MKYKVIIQTKENGIHTIQAHNFQELNIDKCGIEIITKTDKVVFIENKYIEELKIK